MCVCSFSQFSFCFPFVSLSLFYENSLNVPTYLARICIPEKKKRTAWTINGENAKERERMEENKEWKLTMTIGEYRRKMDEKYSRSTSTRFGREEMKMQRTHTYTQTHTLSAATIRVSICSYSKSVFCFERFHENNSFYSSRFVVGF